MPIAHISSFGAATLVIVACSAAAAQDAQPHAPAGNQIVNVASAQLAIDGSPATLSSNTTTLRVDELLDLRFTSSVQAAPVDDGRRTTVPLTLVNTGNGDEAFVLDLSVEGSGATPEGFAIDSDGNGSFDPAIDVAIASGAATRLLAPGETVRLLALLSGDGNPATGQLVARARAATGSGEPGSDFPGQGDGNSDAVVGTTTAMTRLTLPFGAAQPAVSTIDVSLVKSQVVSAADGTGTPQTGSTITYSIAADIRGSGTAPSVRIADPIPAGTTYLAGSLRLDGAPLSDAAGDDDGSFDGAAIAVALGNVTAPAIHNVQFRVTIQ